MAVAIQPSSHPSTSSAINRTSSPKTPIKPLTSSSPANTTTANPTSYLTQLQQNGYVQIPSLLPPHLLLATQATSKYLLSRTRPNPQSSPSIKIFWPHVRTVPKQYPPWPKLTDLSPEEHRETNIWGVQHLLHPDLEGLRDVYAEVYFCDEILGVVGELLASPEDGKAVGYDELVMELFNLLVSPGRESGFELEWHRDDIRPDVSMEEEARLLAEKAPGGRQLHAQYNVALFEDESLVVVPGSHRRIRTDEERSAGKYDRLEGEVKVVLKPGDAVFYDSNILHRGVYKGIDETKDLGRMTLHGSVGLKGYGKERARQVLQHAVGEWIDRPEAAFYIHDENKKTRAEKMRIALVEMGRGKENVGYSLEG